MTQFLADSRGANQDNRHMSDKRRILIVEDDENVLEILYEALVEQGHVIEKATSAAEAMEKLNSFFPELVLTDNDMPEWTGLDMLKELRRRENYVTVIFVSGRTDSKFVSEALRAGAEDYIRKPFRIDELIARVEVAFRTLDLHKQLFDANAKLSEMVEHDDLTGLYNMRSMYQRIDLEIKRAVRGSRNMACVMLDMDNFKTVNDNHDHLFGSFVLQEMGKLIEENMRETDFAARYGGDEFLVVLTETDENGPEKFCERLRASVEEYLFKNDQDEMKLTISLGYAIGGFGDDRDARNLLRAADENLYKSKETGRNRFFGP